MSKMGKLKFLRKMQGIKILESSLNEPGGGGISVIVSSSPAREGGAASIFDISGASIGISSNKPGPPNKSASRQHKITMSTTVWLFNI